MLFNSLNGKSQVIHASAQSRRQFLKLAAIAAIVPKTTLHADEQNTKIKTRALLMHITHYDPNWNKRKDSEQPFHIDVALEVLDKMADHNFNTLIVDIEDGVVYESHPELKRHYSAPMKDLELLAKSAHQKNIDFVPKFNWSKSGRNHHDMWMRPHWHGISWIKDMDTYYKVAGDIIDEIVAVCKPKNYFHIGMDEDHYRSVSQYIDTIKILHEKIKKHNLRPIMWNDTCYENRNNIAQVYADKTRAAEPSLPKDIVQILWDYDIAYTGIVKRLTDAGFTVWVAPGRDKKQIQQWKKILLAEGGSGLLMTNWIKCHKSNRSKLLLMLDQLAQAYQ